MIWLMLRVRASDACAHELSGSPRIGLFSGHVRGFVVFSLERREVKRVIGNASVGPAHSIHVEYV
jgi:hypothetical protein